MQIDWCILNSLTPKHTHTHRHRYIHTVMSVLLDNLVCWKEKKKTWVRVV